MTYVIKFFWVLIFAVALYGVDWLAKHSYFDKFTFSWKGLRRYFSLPDWKRIFPFFAIGVLLLVGFISGCAEAVATPPPVVAVSCQGTYVGGYGPPEHDERIRLRNLSLANRGIAVTGDDNIDNANAGGGPPDGGIWMAGSYTFETDANCNVVSGKTMIFYAYEYDIGGSVDKDGALNLVWSGQGSAGEIKGKVDATGNITGQFFHPAPDNFVYGVLSGTFLASGKL